MAAVDGALAGAGADVADAVVADAAVARLDLPELVLGFDHLPVNGHDRLPDLVQLNILVGSVNTILGVAVWGSVTFWAMVGNVHAKKKKALSNSL